MRIFIVVIGLFIHAFNSYSQTDASLNIEVYDKITKRPLMAIISVLEVGEEQELTGKMQGEFFVVRIKPSTNYQVMVALQEYKTYKQLHQFEPNVTNHKLHIDLEPLNTTNASAAIQEHTILLVDKESKKPINRANILIKDNSGQSVSLQKGSLIGSWSVLLNTGENYRIEISHPDYEIYKSNLVVKGYNPTQIGLTKIFRQALSFQAVDALTNQPVAARFKLTDEVQESYSGNTTTTSFFEPTVLVQNQPYILYVLASGYKDYQDKYMVKLTNEKVLETIKLIKATDLLLKLRVQDEKSRQPLPSSIKVINKVTQQAVFSLTNIAKTEVILNAQQSYSIIVQADGYDTFEQDINTTTNTNKPSELIITMIRPISTATSKSTPTATVATPPTREPVPSKIFNFKIIDAQTRKAINNVKFQLVNTADKKPVVVKSFPSSVQANLLLDQSYVAVIEASNYERMTMNIDAGAWAKRGEFLTNISLIPVAKKVAAKPTNIPDKNFDNLKGGQSFLIEDNVYFDQSSYILRPEASVQLDKLVAALKKNPAIKLEIIGHTDNVGDARLNLILSENRAKVIANYLVYKGIQESRISHKGAGQTKPIAPNDTEDNKRKNRRVEFTVKEN